MEPSKRDPAQGEGRRSRIGVAVAAAAVVVAAAVVAPGGFGKGERGPDLTTAAEMDKMARGLPHTDLPGMPEHRHDDPATKNLISRGAEVGAGAVDPTTTRQRRAAAAYVQEERSLPDPELTTVPAYQPRASVPQDRYAMANGCYTLETAGGYVVADTGAAHLAEVRRREAGRIHFKATRLGGYLLHVAGGVLTASDGVVAVGEPGPSADWTVRRTRRGSFTFRLPG
ncbi:MAG TPA: hypothetical protein VD859_07695, partial [Nocardioides sp.]|nr:hypothetical protein [Nocardioides sp.]